MCGSIVFDEKPRDLIWVDHARFWAGCPHSTTPVPPSHERLRLRVDAPQLVEEARKASLAKTSPRAALLKCAHLSEDLEEKVARLSRSQESMIVPFTAAYVDGNEQWKFNEKVRQTGCTGSRSPVSHPHGLFLITTRVTRFPFSRIPPSWRDFYVGWCAVVDRSVS